MASRESLESPGALRQIQSLAGFGRRSEVVKDGGTLVGEKLENVRTDGWQPARLVGQEGGERTSSVKDGCRGLLPKEQLKKGQQKTAGRGEEGAS